MKKLFIILMFFSFTVQADDYNRIPSAKKTEYKNKLIDIFGKCWQGWQEGLHRPQSEEMKDAAGAFLSELYDEGYIKADRFPVYNAWYVSRYGSQPEMDPLDMSETHNRYKSFYISWINSVYADIASNPKKCANFGDPATSAKCCNSDENPLLFLGLVKADYNFPNSCKDAGKSCTSHSQCCSESCVKSSYLDPNATGVCEPVKTCYELVEFGKECSMPVKPYCVPTHEVQGKEYGISCRNIDAQTTGTKECEQIGKTCAADNECCSLKCENSKCVEQKKCDVCLSRNQKPADSPGVFCCEGLYENLKGRCVPKFPVYVPTSSIFKPAVDKATIIDKFLSLFSISANAAQLCQKFSKEDNDAIEAHIKSCWQKSTPEEETDCLNQLGTIKTGLLAASFSKNEEKVKEEEAKCAAKPAAERAQCIEDNVKDLKAGCQSKMTEEEYADAFNVSSIQTMTFSDPDKCVFNSFHDNWLDASSAERNAEIVMRGFEYAYSGEGAKDMWVQEDQTDEATKMNIFDRARNVAVDVRKARVELIKSSRQTDRRMVCLCVAIKNREGVDPGSLNDFDNDPECAPERAELEARNNSGDPGDGSEGDSTTAEQENANADSSKGAIGITHEQMMMNFLELRSITQMERFERNIALETKLSNLSDYIDSNDWMVATSHEKVPLYEFKVVWYQEWFVWVATIVTGGLFLLVYSISEGGAGNAWWILGPIGLLFCGVDKHLEDIKPQVDLEVIESDNNSKAYNGTTFDWGEGKCHKRVIGICIKDYFKIRRSYIHPEFNNGAEAKYKCDIKHFSDACMRNVYKTKFEDNPRFLIDLKRPLFVPKTAWKDDTGWIKLWNDNVDVFIAALKTTRPNGNQKRKYLDYDIMQSEEAKAAMNPKIGNGEDWVPDDYTDAEDDPNSMKNLFKIGATKYAGCKKLVGNEAGDDCRVETNETDITLEETAIGFGYLFEDTADMEQFAEYAYQHHFHWPSIGASEKVGYPLLAQSAYFQSIATNLALIGSAAASRFNGTGEAFDLYLASWQSRVDAYGCGGDISGACATEEAGTGSTNAKYSKNFRMAFKSLDFQRGEFASDFVDSSGNIKAGSKMSSAEQAILKGGISKAMRAAEKVKEAEHYKKVVGDTARGKVIAKGFDKWNKAFGKPLNKIKMSVGGKDFGGGSKYNSPSGGASDSNSNKGNKVNNNVAAYKAPVFKMPDYSAGGGSYGSNSSSNSSSSSSSSSKKTGVTSDSKLKNTYLLDSAMKSKSMYERDDADSIFKIVSKAYYRNLGLILERAGVKTKTKTKTPGLNFKGTKEDLSKDKKSELKKLLSQ